MVLLFGITDRIQLERVLLGFVAVMFIYEAKSLWEFLVNGRHMYRMGIVRLMGIDEAFSDPNTYAASVAYALPMLGLFWRLKETIYPRRLVTLLLWGLAVVSVLSVLFTGSRSGQLTLLLFMMFWWLRSQRKVKMLVVAALVLTVIWSYLPAQYKGRFESIWDPSATDKTAEESAEGRIEGLKDGYQLMLSRPIFGYGPGSFPIARGEVGHLEGLASHNLYGQVMGDLGFAGVFILLMLIRILWRDSRKLINIGRSLPGPTGPFYCGLGYAILETMALLLFQGNFGHNLYRHTWLWIAAFLMLGLRFAARDVATASSTEEPGEPSDGPLRPDRPERRRAFMGAQGTQPVPASLPNPARKPVPRSRRYP
jgi:O-antigen ligase